MDELPSDVEDRLQRLLLAMAHLTSEQRLDIIRRIKTKFCTTCGAKHLHTGCRCREG